MGNDRTLADSEAERVLVGALTLSTLDAAEIFGIVAGQDFADPKAALAFDACYSLWSKGERIDTLILARECHNAWPSLREATQDLTSWMAAVPYTRSGPKYARLIADMADAREIERRSTEAVGFVRDGGSAKDALDLLARPLVERGDAFVGLHTLDEIGAADGAPPAPWVVPGLIRSDWRIVVVASEGAGKSVLFRQIAALAAQGIHPLSFAKCDPVRTLVLDFENPMDAIADIVRPLTTRLRLHLGADYDPDRAHLWRRVQGIDLRSRTDRAALDQVLAKVKPDLVCAGPVYKMMRRDRQEPDEQYAAALQQVLDDLRTRHNFALLLEHHAPQADAGVRDLRPYGSSLWLRWPEIGLKLAVSDDEGNVDVGRWRRDRLANSWPDKLLRGEHWPWEGYWKEGM